MKTAALLLIALSLSAQSPTPVSGVFHTPDMQPLNGRVEISITRSTISHDCGGVTTQIVPYRSKRVNIVNGVLQAVSLYSSPCLNLLDASTPRAYTEIGAGVGAEIHVSGHSLNGVFTLTTGTAPSAGNLFTVILSSVYPVSLSCLVSSEPAMDGLRYRETNRTIQFSTTVAPAASTVYSMYYHCAVYPYTVRVYNDKGLILYDTKWVVPWDPAAEVTQMDLEEQQ